MTRPDIPDRALTWGEYLAGLGLVGLALAVVALLIVGYFT